MNSTSNRNGKWWLALVAMCCLAPAAFADQAKLKPKLQVPEGGSTATYLLGAGLTCFGAMFLRFGAAKPTRS
jgi:hypothetical protein